MSGLWSWSDLSVRVVFVGTILIYLHNYSLPCTVYVWYERANDKTKDCSLDKTSSFFSLNALAVGNHHHQGSN